MIKGYITSVFGSESKNALSVAECESNTKPGRIGDGGLASTKAWHAVGLPYGESIGVFQIRLLPGRPDKEYLLNAKQNVDYAKKLYDRNGFSPWTCARTLGIVK